jgi:hypothetical protein
VSRCVDSFVKNGYADEHSVVDDCEVINNDDLSLKVANIPLRFLNAIYKTILDLRKPAAPVCNDYAKLYFLEYFLFRIYMLPFFAVWNLETPYVSPTGREFPSTTFEKYEVDFIQRYLHSQPLQQSSSIRLVISTKDLISSSGNSLIADGIFSVRH